MTDFIEAVADRTGVDRRTVEDVLTEASVVIAPTVPTPRHLAVTRVTFTGTKRIAGHDDEDFVYDRELGPGLWVVASGENLAGKSTVLNVIRWALTGRRGRLRDDVAGWINTVRLEGSIDDRPFVIGFTNDDDVRGALTDNGSPAGTFTGEAAFESVTGAYFMDRLGLDATPFWQRRTGGEEAEGDARRLGWQGYFPALHVRSGTGPLLGEQTQGGQPGTLIQVFLGLPWALTAATARVARHIAARELNAVRRRANEDATARERQREPLRRRLDAARAGLRDIERRGAPPTAEQIDLRVREFNTVALRLADAQTSVRTAQQNLDAAVEALDSATRRYVALTETAVIRPLLGRIAPTECPRCTHRLEDVREHREAEEHCFVCDAPLQDPEEDEAQLEEVERELAEAREAHDRAKAELLAASDAAMVLEAEHDTARAAVQAIEGLAPAIAERGRLEQEVAVVEALLAQDEQVQSEAHGLGDLEQRDAVLGAAEAEAVERRTEAAQGFRERLGNEIVSLGQRFGVHNLEAADPKLSAAVRLTIGGATSNFGDLSPGEQLRIRIATLIGLLRIGESLGIGRFPGLLLIDSPNSEEMVEDDAAEIISEIAAICEELPKLEIVLASARPELIEGRVATDRLIGGEDMGMVF